MSSLYKVFLLISFKHIPTTVTKITYNHERDTCFNDYRKRECIKEAIEKAGYKPGEEIMLGMDVASSEFYEDGKYNLKGEGVVRTSEEMVDWYEDMVNKYPIISNEDGIDQNDWEGHKHLTDRLGKKVQLVGDDLFVTNTEKLARGIEEGVSNSILIKVNQIGTL